MPRPAINRRTLIVLLSGILVGFIGLPMFRQLVDNHEVLKPYDFVQYWSAGQQTLHGQDPYDPDQLIVIQRTMYDGVRKAIMMWNPPWTLPITLPFAALPWRIAQLIWLGLQLAAVLLSADMLWRAFGGSIEKRWIAWLVALSFGPTLFVLLMGQISGLALLGLAGFVHFIRKDQPIAAGCCAALTAIKPHLLPLFALALFLEAMHRPKLRRTLLAGGVTLLIASLLPLFWNPDVWSQYFGAMRRPPSDQFETMREFEHPTLGYQIRRLIPGEPFAAQFMPCLVAAIAFIAWWWTRRADWSWERSLPILVLASILTAGYGAWSFDLVLLLPAILQMAVCITRMNDSRWITGSATVYIVLNLWLLRTIQQPGSQSNPWIAPVVLVGYIIIAIATRQAARGVAIREGV